MKSTKSGTRGTRSKTTKAGRSRSAPGKRLGNAASARGAKSSKQLLLEIADLRLHLDEAEETLNAIRRGDVDALVVSGPKGDQVYALKGAEQPYRILVESMNEGALSLMETGRIMNCNKAFASISGMPCGTLIGRALKDFVSEKDAEKFDTFWKQALEKEAKTEIELRFDSRAVPTYLSASARMIEGECWVFAVITDISERKRAEAELDNYRRHLEQLVDEQTEELQATNEELQATNEDLAARTAKFEAMFDTTSDGVWINNLQGEILEVNDAYCRMSGYSRDELTRMPVSMLEANETPKEVAEHIQKVIKTGHDRFESRHRRKDGSLFDVDITALSLDIEGGRIVIFVRDITKRKQVEHALRKTRDNLEAANKELEAFAYSVSHDLRAPLRVIEGFAKAIEEDEAAKLSEAGKDYFHRVRTATEKMGQLIDALLSLSRLTRGELTRSPVYLSSLARTIFEDLKKTDPGRCVECVVPDDVKAEGDPSMLRIVLTNLLQNAWKFTSRRNQARIEFGVLQKDGKAVYFVRDDGAGFDMSYADKLFMPFRRLHSADEFPGLGIGLATVQRIIHLHGGKVWAEGEPDKGAVFYFTL